MRTVVPMKTTYLSAEAVDGGGVEVPPRVLEEVRPLAPAGLGGAKEQPTAVLRFVVDAAGHIGDVELVRADDDALAAPAVEAITRWIVEPARRQGRAIPVVATVQITFDVAPSER